MQSNAFRRCSGVWLVGASLMCPLGSLPASAAADSAALAAWRVEAAETRALADNDAARALREAQQLQSTLPLDATAPDRALILNLLSRIEIYLARVDDSAAHAHAAADIAAKSNDVIGQAEADLNIILIAINQAKFDDMVAATQQAITMLEGVDRPDLLGEAMLRATMMYRRFDQFDESVAVALRAMQMAQRSDNHLVLAYAHQGLAIAYDQSYRYDDAREQSLEMREQARLAHSKFIEAFAVTGLAGWSSETGHLPEAAQLTREATAMFREVGAPFATSYGLYGLADILARMGRHKEAIHDLDQALDIYVRYPNPISTWFALNARSANYQSLGDMGKAEADAERANGIAEGLAVPLYLSGSATRRASVAAAKGDYRRAYELTNSAADLTAKAARDKAAKRLVELINRYESQSKQHAIEELTRRAQQQTTELHERELQQRWLWTVLSGVILALATVSVFVYRLRQSQRRLQVSETHVRALNADLEQRVISRTLELRQQASYLRTLIDMLPMWTWFKDTSSRYLVVNEALASARGHSAASMVGQSDLHLLSEATARREIADDQAVLASRARRSKEELIAGGRGRGEVWMETYKAAVLDEDGTVLGTVGAARDISERKAVESARETALDEVRQLARQRSQFLAQMSHELRTPLNGIMGFAQILRRDSTLTERQMKGVRIIGESGQHLLELIDDILDLARVDAGKLELFPSAVNLCTFLQFIGDTIRVKAEEKGLEFVLEIDADPRESVRIDEKRLRQVLLNLLSNSIRFSDHGRITLQAAYRAPLDDAQPGNLCFVVSDQGIGISAAQVARLFRPFEQGADRKRREGGTGLGLAISWQLVRLMGGDIHVQSNEGEGSVFSFEIEALSDDPSEASVPKEPPIGYRGVRRSILIVDDLAYNRAVLVDALAGLGFEVREADDGRSALDAIARTPPDLVLMDLAMPVMDGLTATRMIRRLAAGARLPIILVSASPTQESRSQSQAAGANAFLSKPIQESALLQAIARLLRLDWIAQAGRSLSAGG